MTRAFAAGAAYFTFVFAAGFVFGAVRTLILEPRLGALAAVAVELPAMLAVSWLACGWTLQRFTVPPELGARAAMGASAFTLLMAAELALAVAFGATAAGFVGGFAAPAGALGLAGQIAFALFPLMRR